MDDSVWMNRCMNGGIAESIVWAGDKAREKG